MEVPDGRDYGKNIFRYIFWACLAVGIVLISLVKTILMTSSLAHLRELWSWIQDEEVGKSEKKY
ncbi:hypothetical protein BDV29DRAFT_172821 [Aspergillus leporis]|uniref:Uncharacterized protein n=1 Tax=Aspergillus leporis TaxID=41062 RepID=A0A5N5X2Q8_9EURO|nr:hypothetical protein BDV29DRAFT_172821 [Aspergillus leporis]